MIDPKPAVCCTCDMCMGCGQAFNFTTNRDHWKCATCLNGPIQDVYDGLIKIQTLFATMGFTLSSDLTYFKDYGLPNNGAARVVPLFDNGTSVDVKRTLAALQITTTHTIPITDSIPWEKFPKETVEDVSRMIIELTDACRKKIVERHILEVECNTCKKTVSDFAVVDGLNYCFDCL